MFDLLAVLGRGIQLRSEDVPSCWVPTEYLEVYEAPSDNLEAGHSPVRLPIDDLNPLCMIGGGEMNLLASMEFYKNKRHCPELVVFAYSSRAKYLRLDDAPSESEVMSELFCREFSDANVVTWTKDMDVPGPSNTYTELQNIFTLAVERRLTSVGIVTVSVHLPRSMVLAQRHLEQPEFEHLAVRYFRSEQVLYTANPTTYWPIYERVLGSKALRRNLEREMHNIAMSTTNVFGDEKSFFA